MEYKGETRDPQILKDHPRNVEIYGDLQDNEFAARVQDDGRIFEPLHISTDNTIISGHRRRHAAVKCKFPSVPVIVRDDLKDDLDIETALVRSNDQREKNNENRIREFLLLNLVEAQKAKLRQLAGLRIGHRSGKQLEDGDEKGGAAELAAKAVGLSRNTAVYGANVIAVIDQALDEGDIERAEHLRVKLNKSISGAFKELAKTTGVQEYEFGRPLDFRGLRHEPLNELGVVFLFGMVAQELGFTVEGIRAPLPDCHGKRENRKGRLSPVRIEFEFKSRNYLAHKHSIDACDVIVCWKNNWSDPPSCIEIVELSREIKKLPKRVKHIETE